VLNYTQEEGRARIKFRNILLTRSQVSNSAVAWFEFISSTRSQSIK